MSKNRISNDEGENPSIFKIQHSLDRVLVIC